IIVTLGNTALRAVTGDKKAAIGDKHAEEIQIGKSVLFPLYHPASVIYNRKLKDTYYEDLDKLKERLRK
ncbi:MAG: uracil-DNA glycosylase, partial [Firmicutes bacterium]|nr:uracil-DNA glycosylase [Bacillota bacterium]